MTQRLIILRGAPSSGKSTIAKKMRNFEERIVWLKVDSFKDFFADDATPALEYVHGSAIATLEYLLDNGFSVVTEGIFQNTKYIDDMLQKAKVRNIPCKIFELEVSLETLQKRDKSREGVSEGFRPALGDEVIERLSNIVDSTAYKGAVKLNTEDLSIDDCIKEINAAFS